MNSKFNPKLYYGISKCIGKNDYHEAIRLLEPFLAKNEKDPVALDFALMCYREVNNEDKALWAALELESLDSNHFSALKAIGEIYVKRNMYDDAVPYVKRALSNVPTDEFHLTFFWKCVIKVLGVISPKLPKEIEKDFKDLNSNKKNTTWTKWAKDFLAWHQAASK